MSWEEIEALELDPRVELIRQLIPLGLAEVGRMLEEEVEQLAWRRHTRKTEDDRHYRHGHNSVSVRLGGQRHPMRVPRVRGPAGESRLAAYEQLHGSPGEMDEGLFRKVLLGISCRDYEAAVEAVPGAIGLSKSTVSREFKKATAAKLKEFQERDLSGYDVVAFVLDGKSFAEDEMVVTLGVTSKGDKVFLGFVQTDTENAVVIRSFLRSLKDRGIDLSAGALVVNRWSPRSPERRPGGLQGTGAHPAVPVAQAGERDLVSAESGAEGLAPASAARLSAAHVRGGRPGSRGPAPGARGGEPVRGGQSR